MKDLTKELQKKEIVYSKLEKLGFEKLNESYIYKTKIVNNEFEMTIVFSDDKNYSKLIDLETGEDYVLADNLEANGKFVGMVREEYNNTIQEIIDGCTNTSVFKTSQSKQVIRYIKEKYNDSFEFLWEKFSDNAIVRNKTNRKWYALLLTVPESKLTGTSDKKIEILDIRYQKGKTSEIVDNEKIFSGYHMNKQSWITIKMDNSVPFEKICELMDNSYQLSLLK